MSAPAELVELTMPSLGADMEAGTLVRWLREEGDSVSRGDAVAEVETDKGIIVVEVFATGVLEKLVTPPGARVPVGTVLALVRPPTPSRATPPQATPTETPARAGAVVRASGLARRLAAERHVPLSQVRGTGPSGAVVAADIESASLARKSKDRGERPPPARPASDAQAAMRRAVGAAMARSKRENPHFYLTATLDMEPALELLATANESLPPADRYLPGVLYVWAVARALRKVPELNARWQGDEAPPASGVHVGFAVSLRGGGLVAPAIHDADRKPLSELMAALRDVVERARTGGLRSSEMADGTITVTSLGERGVEGLVPIIFPPQVAIVGIGKIVERPWVVAGAVLARRVVQLALAADHRVVDGHRAGLFLATVVELLGDPKAAFSEAGCPKEMS